MNVDQSGLPARSPTFVAVEIAPDVRGQPPLFAVAYSPKTPQKWPQGQ
jgi:hypothetical protein